MLLINQADLQRFINLVWYAKNHYPEFFYSILLTSFVMFLLLVHVWINRSKKPFVEPKKGPRKEGDDLGPLKTFESVGSLSEVATSSNNSDEEVIKESENGNVNEPNQSPEIPEITIYYLINDSPPSEETINITIESKPENKESQPKVIGYTPNNKFLQPEPYKYGVVKMPKPKCYVKFARNGRSNKRGFTEAGFLKHLQDSFKKDFQIFDDKHIPTISKRPYEPDFVLINEKNNKNIYIVVEIDEPYDGYQRTPTHCLGDDDFRDDFLTARGWIVIKFAEVQIHTQPKNCCALIAKVIASIDPSYQNKLTLIDSPTAINQWDSVNAKKWASNNLREKYLGITSFGKIPDLIIGYQVTDSESDKIVEAAIPKSKIILAKQSGKLAEKNTIKSRDSRIHFDATTHKYYIDRDPLTISVTQLINKFFPEFDAEYWAPIKAKQRGITTEAILTEWEATRSESSAKGTALHESIEKHYNDLPHDSETLEFQYFLDFKKKYPSLNPFRTEWRIFNEDLMLAGTVDMIYKKDDGQLFMFDWKRSKKVLLTDGTSIDTKAYSMAFGDLAHLGDNSFNRYCLQQNVYKHILETKYGQKISGMGLLILHEDYNSAKFVKIPEMKKEVEYMFNYVRSMK